MEHLAAVFLIILVAAWVAICLPAATRAREKGPLESTALFKRGLELIGPDHHSEFVRTLGRPPEATRVEQEAPRPRTSERPQRHSSAARLQRPPVRPTSADRSPTVGSSPAELDIRRGRALVFVALVGAVVITAGLAVLGSPWELHLATDAVLAIYVSWLLEEKHRRSERKRKVRSLQAARRRRTPEPLRPAVGDR